MASLNLSAHVFLIERTVLYSTESFSCAKQHACCKSHVWTILRVWFARVSKPLNWSAITTKYDRNNWTFFKIRYSVFYAKGRNLTFKIVYIIQYKLGRNWKPTKKSPIKLTFRFGQHSGRRNQRLRYAIILTYTALFKDGARKQKRRIERRISNGTRPFQLNMTFYACDK